MMILTIIIFLFNSCSIENDCKIQTVDDAVFDNESTNIVLTYPTVNNIKQIEYLIENGILDLPNVKFIGIFNSFEKYNFQDSQKYISDNNISFIKLYKIEDKLNREQLFEENESTPEFNKIFNNSDGILFFGGDDLQPIIYKSKTNLLTSIYDWDRHYYELSFLFHLLGGYQDTTFIPLLKKNPEYIINGFCLGMQTMNVATGGDMYQDIPSEIYNIQFVEDLLKLDKDKQHRNYWKQIYSEREVDWIHFHRIKFSQEKLFVKDISFNPLVLSAHHQCIKTLGKELEIFASSIDGKIPEAIYHTKYKNVFSVQFHPEQNVLYSYEDKFKFTPKDTVELSCREILEKDESYKFHLNYWKYFEKIVNDIK